MAIENKNTKKRSIPFYIELFFGSCLVIFLGLSSLVFGVMTDRMRVETISMQPALSPGDYALVNKLAYSSNHLPQRGDVIVFRYPPNPVQIPYIKRIIGIPGDQIHIANGKIYINDNLILEPYLKVTTNRGGLWTIPAGQYFVLGDNRNNSSDSRTWGFVPYENIIGRLELIYLPPRHWSFLSQNITSSKPEP